jgi:hypothetical protein
MWNRSCNIARLHLQLSPDQSLITWSKSDHLIKFWSPDPNVSNRVQKILTNPELVLFSQYRFELCFIKRWVTFCPRLQSTVFRSERNFFWPNIMEIRRWTCTRQTFFPHLLRNFFFAGMCLFLTFGKFCSWGSKILPFNIGFRTKKVLLGYRKSYLRNLEMYQYLTFDLYFKVKLRSRWLF